MKKNHIHNVGLIVLASGALLALSCARPVEKGKFLNVNVTETITLPQLQGRVEVARDEWGIPHIYAENDHDLFFVQGYLHAKDRLFQMLLLRAAAQGQLGLFSGPDQLSTDVSIRLFKFGTVAQEIWDAADAEDQAILKAHSDGINAYINTARWEDLPFELLGLGFTDLSKFKDLPWTPVDSLAFARLMTFQLSFDDEGSRGLEFQTIMGGLEGYYTPLLGNPTATTLSGGMAMDLYTSNPTRGTIISLPTTYGTAPPQLAGRSAQIGEIKALKPLRALLNSLFGARGMSNSWAVAGKNTATGHALLANDPHLDLTQPSIFHEAHLNTKKQGGKYNVAGVMFPPDPGIVIGFTENLAWGETTTGYDVTDFYVELAPLTTTTRPIPTKVCRANPSTPWIQCSAGLTTVTTRSENFMYNADKSKTDPCALDPSIKTSIEDDFPVDVGTPSKLLLSKGVCLLPVTYYEVPGHGPNPIPVVKVLPADSLGPGTPVALVAARWTGLEPTTELRAFFKYWSAKDANEFKVAAQNFSVGAQNHLVADISGNIGWFPYAWIPKKALTSCTDTTFNPASPYIVPPYLPQPGYNSGCNWQQDYQPLDALPQLLDPDQGYIVTANNAPIPLGPSATAPYYHGTFYDIGYRASRIGERIKDIVASGKKVGVDDMKSIQADTLLGPCRDFLSLLTATVGVCFTSSPPTSCPTMPTGADEALEYLEGWDCSTPSGYDISSGRPVEVTDPTVRYNSAAAAVFQAWYGNFIHDTFDDQTDIAGENHVDGDMYGRAIYNITFRPNCAMLTQMGLPATSPCQLTGSNLPVAVPPTFPTAYYSPFWDDIGTSPTVETRNDIIRRAFAEAVQALGRAYSFDPEADRLTGGFSTTTVDDWLWGKLHKLILRNLADVALLNVPSPYDLIYPMGFPRPGGNYVVDSSDPGVAKATASSPRSFTYSGGPSFRFVVDVDPNGVKAYTALPGGEIARPSSAHYDDQVRQLWVLNKYKQFWFADKDVEDHAQSLTVFKKP